LTQALIPPHSTNCVFHLYPPLGERPIKGCYATIRTAGGDL
jgi:hypothetical protein